MAEKALCSATYQLTYDKESVVYNLVSTVTNAKFNPETSVYEPSFFKLTILRRDGVEAAVVAADSYGLTVSVALITEAGESVALTNSGDTYYFGNVKGTRVQCELYQDGLLIDTLTIGVNQDGNSLLNVTNYYMAGISSVEAPDGAWVTDPARAGFCAGLPYLWGKELLSYSQNGAVWSTPHLITMWAQDGRPGADGADGADGKDGRSITGIQEWYYASVKATDYITFNPDATGLWEMNEPPENYSASRPYLWNAEVIYFSDGTRQVGKAIIIGVWGQDGKPGNDGIGITGRQVYYYATTGYSKPTFNPNATGLWELNKIPSDYSASRPYLWKVEIIYYSNGSYTGQSDVFLAGYWGQDGDAGSRGDRGPVLRGPQNWSDCATSYPFEAGGEGDTYLDVVIYNGNYYYCKQSHTKSTLRTPGSSTTYWQSGSEFNIVATKILLAQYALIKNLGVESVEMKDSAGNVLFQVLNGNVICNTGTFKDITVSGQITANQLYYGISTTSYPSAPNATLILNQAQVVLPKVPEGTMRQLRIWSYRLSRTPTNLELIPLSGVSVDTRGGGGDISISATGVATIQSGGINSGRCFDLMGYCDPDNGSTIWCVYELQMPLTLNPSAYT